MTGETNLLTNIENINPVIIDLPNGEKTVTDMQGTVILDKALKLHETLFVPSLRCNLISVSRICKDLNCTITFDKNSYIVQDHTMRTPIGMGEEHDGVYYYKAPK